MLLYIDVFCVRETVSKTISTLLGLLLRLFYTYCI